MKTFDHIQESIQFIKSKTDFEPKFGIVLGTGLGPLGDEIEVHHRINYADIPHFPLSTVEGHKGQLIFGLLDGVKVVAMSGRFHLYEGYTAREITFPIRVLKYLNIERLIISNVSGGTNADYKSGDIVFVRDHINMMGENPLIGHNDERIGPRFPDMLNVYDRDLNQFALDYCKKQNIQAHEGVYLSLKGPSLETPAEYEYIHRLGADLVGMSTVPEVIVCKHMSLSIFVLSVVSNQCYPVDTITETTLEEVIQMAKTVEPKMTQVVKAVLKKLS